MQAPADARARSRIDTTERQSNPHPYDLAKTEGFSLNCTSRSEVLELKSHQSTVFMRQVRRGNDLTFHRQKESELKMMKMGEVFRIMLSQ
jgi:hypothetical protein